MPVSTCSAFQIQTIHFRMSLIGETHAKKYHPCKGQLGIFQIEIPKYKTDANLDGWPPCPLFESCSMAACLEPRSAPSGLHLLPQCHADWVHFKTGAKATRPMDQALRVGYAPLPTREGSSFEGASSQYRGNNQAQCHKLVASLGPNRNMAATPTLKRPFRRPKNQRTQVGMHVCHSCPGLNIGKPSAPAPPGRSLRSFLEGVLARIRNLCWEGGHSVCSEN